MAVVSSMLNTVACCGGSRHSAMTSSALVSGAWSLEASSPCSRCGSVPCAARTRATVVCGMTPPSPAASLRVDRTSNRRTAFVWSCGQARELRCDRSTSGARDRRADRTGPSVDQRQSACAGHRCSRRCNRAWRGSRPWSIRRRATRSTVHPRRICSDRPALAPVEASLLAENSSKGNRPWPASSSTTRSSPGYSPSS